MPQYVEVPGHGIVEFPDGMSDDQIAIAIKSNMQPQQPAAQPETTLQRLERTNNERNAMAAENRAKLPRQLGLAARYGIEGLGQVADIPGAPLASAMNAIGISGAKPPSVALSGILDRLGVPSPATPTERVIGDASRMLAGGGGMVKGAQIAGKVIPALLPLAARPGLQAASAVGGGAAGGYSREAGGDSTDQMIASLAGSFAAPMAVSGVQGLRNAGEAVSRRLMQSALKATPTQHKTGDARVAVDTLLKYGISPTEKGVEKVRSAIDAINDDIAARIVGSNATVSRNKAIDYLSDVRANSANQVSPTTDLNSVQRVADDFLSHPGIANDAIPVQQAQQLKTGTYKALRGQYGQVRGSEIEAQKALARGLKDQIAGAVPGVGPLNAEEGRLLKTLDVAERRALMELNKNPMGLSILAGNKAAFAAFMADRSSAFKALAARAINRSSKALPSYSPTLAEKVPVSGAMSIQDEQP